MIKKFEQFVSELNVYHINEGFQSSKLRNLIKEHGFPRENFYKHCLYDIKDEDIIDVLDWVGDYFDKYSILGKNSKSGKLSNYRKNKQETFLMILEDGTCVVLGNMGIKLKDTIKSLHYGLTDEHLLSTIFGKRYSERHKGNLGQYDGGKDKHTEYINRLNSKRLVDKLRPFVEDIVEYVDSMLNDLFEEANGSVDNDNYEMTWINYDGQSCTGKSIKLDGNEYYLNLQYKTDWSKTKGREDKFYKCDLYYTLENFKIMYKGAVVTNEDLDITYETYDYLFKTHTKKNMKTHKDTHSLKNYFSGEKGRYLVKPSDPNAIYN